MGCSSALFLSATNGVQAENGTVNLMDDDAKIEALKQRINQAQSEEDIRSGKKQGGSVDDNYRLGNRVLADLVAGIGGGALVGWVLDYFIGTSPWLLLIFLALGIVVAFRNIIKLSNEIAKKHK